jgi:hypothetical protein
MLAQDRTITGRVLDPKGDPIPLATVLIKGTSKSTVANDKGEFSITVSGKNPVLVVTAVNHAASEIVIGAQSDYQAELKETGNLPKWS